MYNQTIILPTAYHPSILYFVLLHHAKEVVIDIHEHYYKQTYRNRTVIYSTTGKQSLTVPIMMGRSPHIPVKQIRISHTDHWQHLHLRAIDTAYHSTPFFDIIFPDIERIINQNFNHLWEMNNVLLDYYLSLLHLNIKYEYSTKYVEDLTDTTLDLRKQYSPKKDYQDDFPFLNKPYYQVFADRQGFIPELSILDLVMHLGHEAGYYIRTII